MANFRAEALTVEGRLLADLSLRARLADGREMPFAARPYGGASRTIGPRDSQPDSSRTTRYLRIADWVRVRK